MKKTIIILSIIALFVKGAYSQEETINQSFMKLPLKIGQNLPVQFETLHIDSIEVSLTPNAFIDYPPIVGLYLQLTEYEKKRYTYFSWEASDGYIGSTVPLAFGRYLVSIEAEADIDEKWNGDICVWRKVHLDTDSIFLRIEKLDFGKEFTISKDDDTAKIGNFSIACEESEYEVLDIVEGSHFHIKQNLKILVSDGNEQKEFYFGRLPYYAGEVEPLLFEWKDYQIFVFDKREEGFNILRFKVLKITQ